MLKVKTLSVFAGMLVMLAVSATPSSAWWQSTNGQSQGNVTVTTAGEFVDEGIPVICAAKEIVGQWHLQTAGQIKEHQVGEKQQPTTLGPHLYIQIKSWGKGCKSKIGGNEFEAKVSSCEFQLVQAKESLKATAAVTSPCTIETGPCVLIVPAGLEKSPESNEGMNVGLTEVSLGSVLGGKTAKTNVKGIHVLRSSSSKATCPLVSNEKGELKGLVAEAEGVKTV